MKNAFRKNIFRTIRKSLGRYIAILAIIALGVGFFSGLKTSMPSMIKTGQEYVNRQNMFDYRLISTWGFNAEEVEQIGELAGVRLAEGAVWEDFIYTDEEGTESCLKALSITESVNQLTLSAGRMPEAANECVVDGYRYPETMIGQEITISKENSQDTRDSFAYDTYTVTGLVRSPLYMNMERGTTTIGSGKLDGFIFIPLSGFSYEYFEEVYVRAEVELTAFSEEYEDYMEASAEGMEENTFAIVEERYQKEIADAEAEIADAEEEIADAEKELETEVAEAREELADAKKELTNAEKELADGEAELNDAEQMLQEKEKELAEGEAALKDGETVYQQGLSDYEAGIAAYESGREKLEAGRSQYEQALAGKRQMEALMSPEMLAQDATYQQLAGGVAEFEKNEQLLNATKVQLDEAKAQLDASYVQIQENKALIEAGKRQLAEGREEIVRAKVEIADGKQEIEDGWKEYEDGLAELEAEEADARIEIADAKEELADAKEELAEVEEVEIYVLDRNTNIAYASFENDTGIVEGVAKIFPIFFFLIAALVCSTTMTRMVDDERTQIGTLRAVGYSESAILFKYLVYSGSAAGIGAIIGYFLGTRLFPWAIWTAYGVLYGFADIILVDMPGLFVISLLVALLCSAGTTFAACRVELSHAPAELIRPKTPSAGKRILLERISFFWKRLKFLHKVSARNVFRFKKRMFMMILGIAGCTALVLAGFGVKDSVSNIVNNQYDQILKYDISATYTEEVTAEDLEEIRNQFSKEIATATIVQEISVDAPSEKGVKSVTLLSSADSSISNSVDFHLNKEEVALPDKGEILIDERLAKIFGVEIGGEITLKSGEEETKPLKVAGIFENYTFYYAYVTGETYQEYFPENFVPKTIYLSLEEEADHYKVASYLSDMENAANVSVVADTRAMVENTMQSVNYIVALVIASAAALAFIVLFNLGNINISERVREIATLKVLGFYPRETGAYVFRESAVLSALGILVGIPLGIVFHRFVMGQIKVDMVSFEIRIRPISFLYSVIAVWGFTVCVDLIMRRKINRINMAESLKSIE